MRKRIACCLSAICGMALTVVLSACMNPAVGDAMKAIDAIGEVTIESEPAINEANEKYDALDSEQKAEVKNYANLESANIRLEEVKNEARYLDTISSGLMSRLDDENKSTETFAARAACIAEAVQNEQDGIAALSDLRCSDAFEAIVTDYAAALSSQIKGLDGYPGDASLYNESYVDQGLKKQIECIKLLMNDYGFVVDNAHENMLSDFLDSPPSLLADPGQELEVFTKNGDVKIAFNSFVASSQHTDMAIESGEMTNEQEYGSLLITIDNLSYNDLNINGGMGTYVNTDDIFHLCGMDGAAIGTLNSSWGYPGYEFSSNIIGIDQGVKKRIEITYAIDAGTSDLEVVLSSNVSVILPVERI